MKPNYKRLTVYVPDSCLPLMKIVEDSAYPKGESISHELLKIIIKHYNFIPIQKPTKPKVTKNESDSVWYQELL